MTTHDICIIIHIYSQYLLIINTYTHNIYTVVSVNWQVIIVYLFTETEVKFVLYSFKDEFMIYPYI